MLAREAFIGTIFMDRFLIVGVAGEGAEGVVFEVAEKETPDEVKQVIKMYKPLAFLEMGVLSYNFKIFEQRYPDHPLKMTDEERMNRLKEEMLARLKDPGTIYRLHKLMVFYRLTCEVIARQYYNGYRHNSLPERFLEENPAISIFVDDVLRHNITQLIEEDAIQPDYMEFFEFISEHLDETLQDRVNTEYISMRNAVLCLLLGLHMEAFINEEETLAIAEMAAFREMVSKQDIWVLFNFVTVLYYNLQSKMEDFSTMQEPENAVEGEGINIKRYEYDSRKSEIENQIKLGILACNLLVDISMDDTCYVPELSGLGYLWLTYFLSSYDGEEVRTQSINYLQEAARLFEEIQSFGNMHDVYQQLAVRLKDTDAALALKYMEKAKAAEALFYSSQP